MRVGGKGQVLSPAVVLARMVVGGAVGAAVVKFGMPLVPEVIMTPASWLVFGWMIVFGFPQLLHWRRITSL